MTTARAGWAEVETTPPLGLPMGGRGPRFTPGAHILDPLCAQATVLEDPEGKRTLWVSVDLIGLAPIVAEPLRYDLSALTGIPIEAVILNFSHTHSGPMGGFEGYATTLPNRANSMRTTRSCAETSSVLRSKPWKTFNPLR